MNYDGEVNLGEEFNYIEHSLEAFGDYLNDEMLALCEAQKKGEPDIKQATERLSRKLVRYEKGLSSLCYRAYQLV
jgi:hypothetical protein